MLAGIYDGMTAVAAMMALALLYIVSPIDLLPEALMTIPGLADDAAVAAWLVAATFGATTAYRAWENNQSAPDVPLNPNVVPGEVL